MAEERRPSVAGELAGWRRANLDEDGFMPVERLRQLVAERGLAALPPVGALLVVDAAEDRTRVPADAPQREEGADKPPYVGCLSFLIKRAGNPFPDYVSLGRGRNADLTLQLSAVSKVHAAFHRAGDGWEVSDQRSSNGTTVNATRLAEGARHKLTDGDRVRLGDAIAFEFLEPTTLLARLAGD